VKRIPINTSEFLRQVLAQAPLTWEERAQLERVLGQGNTRDIELAVRSILEGLIERGGLVVLDRKREGDQESLSLRDPERKYRVRIRLPLAARAPAPRVIPYPLDLGGKGGFRYHQVQGLLAIQGNLVTSDRVMTSRELVQRLERALQELVPVALASFHAQEMPPGENWPPPIPADGLPVSAEALESLSRQKDHVLLYPDLGKDGSLLLIGLGDSSIGWRGVLILRHPQREYFTSERIALGCLVAQHFQSLLSTSIRLQGIIFYDFLTGIYNRSYFEEQLEREIAVADRRGQSMALLIIDIDDFKAFNTRYGYEGGDRALATVACVLKAALRHTACVLKAALRHTDTLARYGGEEFAVILAPPVPVEEARLISERLRSAVAEEPLTLRSLDGKSVTERVTVSLGGALYPNNGRNLRDLWNGANRLLLEAKAMGKNQVRFAGDPS
jgi:diguanylate cyclase (GGDEF)-like protein